MEPHETGSATPVDGHLRSPAETYPQVRGTRVVFQYDGDAQSVCLKHWMHGLPTDVPFSRVQDSRWRCEIELPSGCRFEYKFAVRQNGGEHWILDPGNPDHAPDPFGGNSVVHTSSYRPPESVTGLPGSRVGTLEQLTFRSQAMGRDVAMQIYLPSGYSEVCRYPLLVIHDGSDFLEFANLKQLLDNLIRTRAVRPMVAALIDPQDRNREYIDDAAHARMLADELMPIVEQRYGIDTRVATKTLLGASLGAVASLSTAWRFPEAFGQLVLCSGSFVATGSPLISRPEFEHLEQFVHRFRRRPGRPVARAFVSCGAHESLVVGNRSLAAFMVAQNIDTRYEEAPDGHHWHNWRDRLPSALSWLFAAASTRPLRKTDQQ